MPTPDGSPRRAPMTIRELADHQAIHGGYPTPSVQRAVTELLHDDAYPVGPTALVPRRLDGASDVARGLDFFDEALAQQRIPGQLVHEFVTGTYLGSCDWGYCNRPQIGWAMCEDTCCPSPRTWTPICDACSRGIRPVASRPPGGERSWHPVGQLITFDDVRAARRRADLEEEPILEREPFLVPALRSARHHAAVVEVLAGAGLGFFALGAIYLLGHLVTGWTA